MKILLQLFFINNEYTFNRWITSFEAVPVYDDWELYIIGYVDDIYFDRFREKLKIKSCTFIRNYYNHGKSFILNNIVKFINYDIILCFDGDIILNDKVAPVLEDKLITHNLDIIIPIQEDDNRNYIWNPINVAENLFFVKNNYGLSGGIFLTKKAIIDNNPLPLVGSFGPEDVIWFSQLDKINIIVYVCNLVKIIHPSGEHKSYDIKYYINLLDSLENVPMDKVINPKML